MTEEQKDTLIQKLEAKLEHYEARQEFVNGVMPNIDRLHSFYQKNLEILTSYEAFKKDDIARAKGFLFACKIIGFIVNENYPK